VSRDYDASSLQNLRSAARHAASGMAHPPANPRPGDAQQELHASAMARVHRLERGLVSVGNGLNERLVRNLPHRCGANVIASVAQSYSPPGARLRLLQGDYYGQTRLLYHP